MGNEQSQSEQRRKAQWETGGGVVWDPDTDKVMVVQNRKEKEENGEGWTWPKGRVDPGETVEEAAVREIQEESGVKGVILDNFPIIQTKKADRYYYLLQYHSKVGEPDEEETLEVRWVTWGEAKQLLSRDRDQQVLQQATKSAKKFRPN